MIVKRASFAVFALMICSTLAFAQSRTRTHVFRGSIMDSACAATGSHSAGYKMTGTHTPKACTLACVKAGSKFVLYNARHKRIYQLDNQEAPRAFAGDHVRVIGTYDSATRTIHVEKIEPAR